MNKYKTKLESVTIDNKNYRKVLSTNKHQQLVVMSIPPGIEIGKEVHRRSSQFIRIEKGKGIAEIGGSLYRLKAGDAVMIPAKTKHNIINTGNKDLKLYTVYSPPVHNDNIKQRYKKE